ncbi:XdhC family protein [candidate division KSB1 bacterium]|nr:XdhC family protein [candidate division KSB1 bacterium]
MKRNLLSSLLETVQQNIPAVLATLTRGAEHEIGAQLLFRNDGSVLGDTGDASLVARAQAHAQKMFGHERTETVRVGAREIFLESYCPPPKLIIVGAVHIAIPLVTFAKELGYKVILVDPRRAFATPERFPHVNELVTRWPEAALAEIGIDASTCLVVLTHDPKLDDPAVTIALQHAPAYLGVLGSRKTHEKRLQRLREQGLSEAQLARLHAPIGMAIGAHTPAEIALSIMAEITAVRRGALQEA